MNPSHKIRIKYRISVCTSVMTHVPQTSSPVITNMVKKHKTVVCFLRKIKELQYGFFVIPMLSIFAESKDN